MPPAWAEEGAADRVVEPMGPASLPPPRPVLAQLAPATPASPATAIVPLVDPGLERDEDAPLAGYSNGAMFLRSRDSNFVFYPNGRLNIDAFFFPNRGDVQPGVTQDGVNDQRPRDTLFIRRARAEFNGTVLKHFDYMLAGEFASIPIMFQSAQISDVFINVNYTPWANIQIGQFDAPFTLENRTVDKYIDFMERSITVRSFGVPMNKEIGVMVHGLAPQRFLRYELGVFNGDGGNVRNPDNHFDLIGRAYFAPLALLPRAGGTRWLSEIWVGGSVWYGQRVDVPYDGFPPLSSNGGATFVPPVFGNGNRLVPNGQIFKWALEVNVPIGPIGWRFEMVRSERDGIGIYEPHGNDAANNFPLNRALSANINRRGTSFYLQMWYWILGSPTMLPTPGQEIPQRWAGFKKGKENFPIGLYVSARYERMFVEHDEIVQEGRSLSDEQRGILGHVSVDSFGAAVNLWLTRHVRFSANYFLNYLDGNMPVIQGMVRFPPAGALMQPTYPFYRTAEHELLFRAALAL
jgi:phosphate-selective porin